MKVCRSELRLENFNRCPGENFDNIEYDFNYIDVVEDDESKKIIFVNRPEDWSDEDIDDESDWRNSKDTVVVLIDTKRISPNHLGEILAHISIKNVNDSEFIVRDQHIILRLWWD